MKRQLCRFLAIGVLSTVAYSVLFLVFREAMPAAASNAVALLVTALANTEANRRVTFAVRGSEGRLRDHAATWIDRPSRRSILVPTRSGGAAR